MDFDIWVSHMTKNLLRVEKLDANLRLNAHYLLQVRYSSLAIGLFLKGS